MNACTET